MKTIPLTFKDFFFYPPRHKQNADKTSSEKTGAREASLWIKRQYDLMVDRIAPSLLGRAAKA